VEARNVLQSLGGLFRIPDAAKLTKRSSSNQRNGYTANRRYRLQGLLYSNVLNRVVQVSEKMLFLSSTAKMGRADLSENFGTHVRG
jgi:hypothetical protein